MSEKYPAIFIGHGSPQNAIEDNEFSRSWIKLGKTLSKPDAVVVISAHWQTDGVRVTGTDTPKQIYDFYGFPDELYQYKYPVKGSIETAQKIGSVLQHECKVKLDSSWGIDHGAWSVLARLFPEADVPVVQLSLNVNMEPSDHWQVAQKLQSLRHQNILILGSGNMVHNLGKVESQDKVAPWAAQFDAHLKLLIETKQYEQMKDYRHLPGYQLAIPTSEHYLPLLYILAQKTEDEAITFLTEKVVMGSISMRSMVIA